MKKYVEALTASKEDREKGLAPARAEEQKAHIGLTAKSLEIDVMGARNQIEEMCGQYPLPVEEIIRAQDDLDLNQRRLDQLVKLQTALFGA